VPKTSTAREIPPVWASPWPAGALRRRGRGPAGRAGNARPTLRTPHGPA